MYKNDIPHNFHHRMINLKASSNFHGYIVVVMPLSIITVTIIIAVLLSMIETSILTNWSMKLFFIS